MLETQKHLTKQKVGHFYGQENNPTTYNLARMNMLMHGVDYQNFDIYKGDTLINDMYGDDLKLTVQVANPPYSLKWSADSKFLDDPRYSGVGKLAPKSHADLAFLQHMVYHMDETDGRIAVLLPHGVLFRGAGEGTIRQILLENGSIYAVIGLPSNMFYNTSIPTCIIVLKKHREGRDVLFIDASKLFEKEKKQNVMREEHIDRVIELYKDRKTIEKEAYLASFDDIQANDFNLNIPRYVDTSEEEEEVDLKQLSKEIKETNDAIKEANANLLSMLEELAFGNNETKEAVEEFIKVFKEV